MKKLLVIITVLVTLTIGFSLLTYEMFEAIDHQMVEPMVAANLKKHNYKFVTEDNCAIPAADPLLLHACELLNESSVDANVIKRIFGKSYQFKGEFSYEDYDLNKDAESKAQWYVFFVLADAFDAYKMEYSHDYIENWNYSKLNFLDNYRVFTARFSTSIFTSHYERDYLIFRDKELLIISKSEDKILVRKIYRNVEEYYIFI